MEHLRRPLTCITALPTDVIHQVLRSCVSKTDLFAAIRSCKDIYATWKEHPNTILRTVVCTQLDMDEDVFPVAFGAVLHLERARDNKALPVKALLTEDELSPTRLNYIQWIRLASIHGHVKRLEKEFSKRMKNSSYGYSVLTSLERCRFHTAAYIFQQFQALFGIDMEAIILPWEFDLPPPSNQLTRVSFLETFPTTSLLHLSAFKDYLLIWADKHYQLWKEEGHVDKVGPDLSPDQFRHFILSAGLYWYFDAYEDTLKAICGYSTGYAKRALWIADDLNEVISARGVTLEQSVSDDAKLVIVHGELFTTCQKCNYEAGGDFYNNTNYDEAANLILARDVVPGLVIQMLFETGRLPDPFSLPEHLHVDVIRELLDPCPASSSPQGIDMADVNSQTATPELPLASDPTGNYVYDPRHMLCLRCLSDELSMRFWG